jgi:enoyl-CoA hydratase
VAAVTEGDDAPVLLVETRDRIRVLTLNRPYVRNALSQELRTRFFAALAEVDDDDTVDVVIVTGADPAFCAGLDLRELGAQAELPDLTLQWPVMKKPVIGAINGVAVTGGFEIAMNCDFLIASQRARFADTHTRVGLLPRWGMSVRLPQLVGRGLARRLSLTGEFLSSAEALTAGLVTEVVAHEDLLVAARKVALAIVENNQGAVGAVLGLSHRIDDAQSRQLLAMEVEAADNWRRRGVTPADIAANRESVRRRGQAQLP